MPLVELKILGSLAPKMVASGVRRLASEKKSWVRGLASGVWRLIRKTGYEVSVWRPRKFHKVWVHIYSFKFFSSRSKLHTVRFGTEIWFANCEDATDGWFAIIILYNAMIINDYKRKLYLWVWRPASGVHWRPWARSLKNGGVWRPASYLGSLPYLIRQGL